MNGRAALLLLLAMLALLVIAAPAGAEALRLLPSSHECPEGSVLPGARPSFYRTCTFHNLYMWQGMAYYVVPDGGVREPALESIGLRFEIWSRQEGPDAVLGFVQPVRAAAFLQLLARTAPGQQVPAAVDSEIPLAYFWKPRKVWPSSLADKCATGTGPGRANYYHFFGEWLPALSFTLCEQFGHCSYADRSKLQIIDVFSRYGCHFRERYPLFYHEAVACLSDKPLHHINGTTLRSQLTLVQTAWMGLGPRCRGVPPGCYKRGSGRLPPTVELTASWRNLLAQCFGTQPEPPAPLQPLQLVIIDRQYASGRHMLNINTIMRELQRRYSPQHVQVRLVYMEGMTLRQQAELWSKATVVLHIHGASIANYFFLPKHAVAVQLAPMLGHYRPAWYTDYLQDELRGITDIEVIDWQSDDPSLAHLNTEKMEQDMPLKPKDARFVANRTLYGHLSRHYTCPEWMSKEARLVCTALLYNINVYMPVEAAVNLTDQAVRRAFEKQARPVPEGLLASDGTFSGSAGSTSGSGFRGGAQIGSGYSRQAAHVTIADSETREDGGHRNSSGGGSGGGSGSSNSLAVLGDATQPPLMAGAAGLLGVPSQQPLPGWGGLHVLLLGVAIGAALVVAGEPCIRRHCKVW